MTHSADFMTPLAEFIVGYCEGGGAVRFTDDRVLPIKSIGNLPMSVWCGKIWKKEILAYFARVPLLGNYLLSLKMMADRGHTPEKRNNSFWSLGRETELSFWIPMTTSPERFLRLHRLRPFGL